MGRTVFHRECVEAYDPPWGGYAAADSERYVVVSTHQCTRIKIAGLRARSAVKAATDVRHVPLVLLVPLARLYGHLNHYSRSQQRKERRKIRQGKAEQNRTEIRFKRGKNHKKKQKDGRFDGTVL